MCTAPYIRDLSNPSFVNDNIPTTILVTRLDEDFTILEANNEYYNLVGYTKEELWEKYQNKGFDTLHHEDRDAALELMQFQVSNPEDTVFSVKSRLVHKKDGYRMAHFRGKVSTNEQGENVVYFLITDITSQMSTMKALEEEREFNNMISMFTDNIFFDYNVETRTVRHSSIFADRLGIPNIIADYPESMVRLGVMSECDFQEFSKKIESLTSDTKAVVMEFPMTSLSGEILWYRCEYRPLFNSDEVLFRVVGKMTDITAHRTQIDELSEVARLDPYTGLLNKKVAEHSIEEYLKLSAKGQINALIIIDMDKFKELNDTLGHLYGDKAIQDVACILKQRLRSDDIIGRIGGDEFIVLMKNCKTLENVYFKAKELNEALRLSYKSETASVQISASIGISLWDGVECTFEQLYTHADQSLYAAKNAGRNRFQIHNISRLQYDLVQ